jgi:hypothetical protein
MALFNKIQEISSGMTSKQKGLTVVTILMLAVVIYEVMQIFPSDTMVKPKVVATATKVETPATGGSTTTTTSTVSSTTPLPGGASGGSNASPIPTVASAPMPVASQAPSANDQVDSEVLRLQQEAQVQYISKLNELQMLKIQREIAETNQAIAAAKFATVNSEKSIAETLTKSAAPPPSPTTAAEVTSLLPEKNPQDNLPALPTTKTVTKTVTPPPPPPIEVTYTTFSVVMHEGRWSAVVGYNGRLFDVVIGQQLSPDGSVVTAIDRNGVTLMKDGKEKKIPMNSSV